MSRMKVMSGGRHFSVRAIVSTLLGEGADSVLFFPIAFGGVLQWDVILELIVAQTALKTAYEILILPVTVRVVKRVKRIESIDVFDRGISYSWW